MNFPMTTSLQLRYSCSEKVCPCHEYHTCEVRRLGEIRMGPSEVNVKIEILRNHVDYHQTGFGNLMFELRRCPHEIDLHVEPRMTTNQWVHVAMHDDVFILFQAELKTYLM